MTRILFALVAGLVLSSCGAARDEAAPATGGTPPAGKPAQVDITAPLNGAAVHAKPGIGARLVAQVAVKGRAEAGSKVVVRTSCEKSSCRRSLSVGADARFSGRMPVWSLNGLPSGYVVAGAAGSAPADRARIVVALEPVAAARGKEPARARTRESAPPAADPLARAAQPVPATSGPRTLRLIGDSLAQGTEPYLPALLAGWSVTTDARLGRPLAEGMRILRATQLHGSAVLAFSLFTNDAPGNVATLEAAVRRSVQRAGPRGCAIWATIARPPLGRISYAAANTRLKALADDPQLRGRLVIVPWAAAVAQNPALLGRDRVHATTAGYRLRARLYADGARACPA